MPRVVISDTSCLIALSNIGELDLLELLYKKIFTTPQVLGEFGEELPEWVVVTAASDQEKLQILSLTLDVGEASAFHWLSRLRLT